MVIMIMRKPGDTVRITGSMLISQLAAIEQTTSAATARFLRVLGTIIAINMPVQGHAERIHYQRGQHIAKQHAKRGSGAPARNGGRHSPIAIIRGQLPGVGRGNSENFIGDAEGHKKR